MAAGPTPFDAPPWARPKGYRGLILERAMRSGYNPATPTNRPTHTLFNQAGSNYSLVVREVRSLSGGTTNSLSAYTQAPLGSVLGTAVSVLANHASGPGVHYYSDTATTITGDFMWATTNSPVFWSHEFPFAVLPPGYGLVVQGQTTAINVLVAFLWEYVLSEELNAYY